MAYVDADYVDADYVLWLAGLTQHRPHGAFAGRQFGAFAGKTPSTEVPPGPHPVGKIIQARPHGALAGRRFGSFAGKTGTAALPPAPTNVVGTATGGTTIYITITDNSGGTAAHLWQIRPAGGTWVNATGGTNMSFPGTTSFTAMGLTPAHEYELRVLAWSGGLESAYAYSADTVWTDNTGGGDSGLPGATTATVARPEIDVSAGTWLPSTGSDLFSMVDEETPSDADYIYTDAPGECQMTLSDTAFPGGATQTVSFRAKSTTSATLTVTIKQGATVIATWSQALTPTDTTYSRNLSAGEIALLVAGPVDVVLGAA